MKITKPCIENLIRIDLLYFYVNLVIELKWKIKIDYAYAHAICRGIGNKYKCMKGVIWLPISYFDVSAFVWD